jgi:hypothetical protein
MSGGTWIDGCYVVERPTTSHMYVATDDQGTVHKWLLTGNGYGGFQFTRLRSTAPDSPVLWGIMAVRGWLLTNGYTPRYSQSPMWQRQIVERRDTLAHAA